MAELIDEPLATLGLLHDPLLVVLPDAAAQLVVIHRGSVLSFTPEPGHANRVLDLEHTLAAIQPADTGSVGPGTLQQLFQKLPEVDVGATVSHLAAAIARSSLQGTTVFVLVCKKAATRREPHFRE